MIPEIKEQREDGVVVFYSKYHKFSCPVCGKGGFVNPNGNGEEIPDALERHIISFHGKAPTPCGLIPGPLCGELEYNCTRRAECHQKFKGAVMQWENA